MHRTTHWALRRPLGSPDANDIFVHRWQQWQAPEFMLYRTAQGQNAGHTAMARNMEPWRVNLLCEACGEGTNKPATYLLIKFKKILPQSLYDIDVLVQTGKMSRRSLLRHLIHIKLIRARIGPRTLNNWHINSTAVIRLRYKLKFRHTFGYSFTTRPTTPLFRSQETSRNDEVALVAGAPQMQQKLPPFSMLPFREKQRLIEIVFWMLELFDNTRYS